MLKLFKKNHSVLRSDNIFLIEDGSDREIWVFPSEDGFNFRWEGLVNIVP